MLEGNGTELWCGEGLEGTVEGANRRARRGDDNNFGRLGVYCK